MRGFRQRVAWIVIAAVLAFAGCATAPTEYREPPALGEAGRRELNQRVFARVWRLVHERYFDATFHGVDWRAMGERYRGEAVSAADAPSLYAVLNRMCAELKDSHLVALEPRRAHEFKTEHRAAVGMRFQLIDHQRVVTDVVPGSPAERAGIRRGWILLTRNGAPLRDGDRFVGRLGEPIRFEFLDTAGAHRALTIQPELLRFERHEVRRLPGNVAYLRFDKFKVREATWLNQQLKQCRDASGVVLDLRQNGGGETFALDMAVAAFFPRRVPEGTMVRRDRRSVETASLPWMAARYSGPVVVLIGPYTASAAEILTHVLQHHHRAVVVGRKSAGAVVQAVFHNLPDRGKLELPVTDYLGLDGRRLEGRGITPDILLSPPTFADLRADRDPELDSALAALRKAPASSGRTDSASAGRN